jgi:hypothetical protein
MVKFVRPLFNSSPAKLQKTAPQRIGTLIAKRRRGGRKQRMSKGLITIVCLIVLTLSAIPAGAQTRYRRYDSQRSEQRYDRRYDRWDNRSVWDRHRDKITTAAGAGAGALIGAAVGGKKGAIIGAIAGGGGAALYTYKIRDDRNDRYRNRYRRRY